MGPEILILALAEIGRGNPTGQRITARQLVDNPKSYYEQRVVLPDLPCVDDPKGGFICVTTVAGRALRIQASGLGAKTALPIAEQLTGECRGTANLHSPACRFTAEITPINSFKDTLDTPSGNIPIVVVFTVNLDLYRPKR